jgi:hypothetical protein
VEIHSWNAESAGHSSWLPEYQLSTLAFHDENDGLQRTFPSSSVSEQRKRQAMISVRFRATHVNFSEAKNPIKIHQQFRFRGDTVESHRGSGHLKEQRDRNY